MLAIKSALALIIAEELAAEAEAAENQAYQNIIFAEKEKRNV